MMTPGAECSFSKSLWFCFQPSERALFVQPGASAPGANDRTISEIERLGTFTNYDRHQDLL
jgi:hypothetical protein